MQNAFASRVAAFAAVIGLMGLFPQSGGAQVLEPISFNLRVPAPDTHIAEVEAIFPTGGGVSIEIMVDSPIVAGDPVVHEFEVDGSQHFLVNIGDAGSFDGQKAAGELRKIALETRGFWGFLPFKKKEHLNRRPPPGSAPCTRR
jgi:hypothetical protein